MIEIENVYLLYIAINLIYQIHLMYSSKKVLIHLGILVLEALHLHRETTHGLPCACRSGDDAKHRKSQSGERGTGSVPEAALGTGDGSADALL